MNRTTLQKLARALTLAATVIVAGLTASPAQSQQFASPTKAQLDLYQAGSQAFAADQFDPAVEFFEASLQIGELNITYLNLGRALFKAGKCQKAVDTFAKVASAPQIKEPAPVEVLRRLNDYRAELQQTCAGTLEITCEPKQLRIRIDDEKSLRPCPRTPIELSPGTHTITALDGTSELQRTVEIKAMEKSHLPLIMDATPSEPAKVEKPVKPKQTDPIAVTDTANNTMAVAGWTQIALGAGALVGALVVDQIAQDSFDSAEALAEEGEDREAFDAAKSDFAANQTLTGLLVGTSAILLVSGAVFVFVLDEDGEQGTSGNLKLNLAPGGIGVSGAF